jgi:hypothetical protein
VAVACALAVTGSAAYAAETGALPDSVQQTAHDLFSALGVPAPATSDGSAGRSHGANSGRPSNGGHTVRPTPSGAVALELCQAWDAAQKDPHGKAMAAEALRALLDAAGGDRSVPTFCANVLAQNGNSATPHPPNPPPTPSHPGNGNGNGNGRGRPSPSNR